MAGSKQGYDLGWFTGVINFSLINRSMAVFVYSVNLVYHHSSNRCM
jgi:hypothetical protein